MFLTPSCANLMATARPSPRELPVISAVRNVIFMFWAAVDSIRAVLRFAMRELMDDPNGPGAGCFVLYRRHISIAAAPNRAREWVAHPGEARKREPDRQHEGPDG